MKKLLIALGLCLSLGVGAESFQADQVILMQKENIILLKKLKNAQALELKNFKQHFAVSWKQFNAEQSAQLQAWEKQEKQDRYRYFETHLQGPERRTYVQQFLERRRLFRQTLQEAKKSKTQGYREDLKKMLILHSASVKNLEQSLQRGETPSVDLWPK